MEKQCHSIINDCVWRVFHKNTILNEKLLLCLTYRQAFKTIGSMAIVYRKCVVCVCAYAVHITLLIN